MWIFLCQTKGCMIKPHFVGAVCLLFNCFLKAFFVIKIQGHGLFYIDILCLIRVWLRQNLWRHQMLLEISFMHLIV